MLLAPVWCDPVHSKLIAVILLLMLVFRISFTTALQELGNSSVRKLTKLFKRSTIRSVVVPLMIAQCALNEGRQYGLTNKMIKHCTTLLPSLRLTFQRQVGREFDCYWTDKMSSTSPQLANLKYGQVPSKYSPFALYPNQSYSVAHLMWKSRELAQLFLHSRPEKPYTTKPKRTKNPTKN